MSRPTSREALGLAIGEEHGPYIIEGARIIAVEFRNALEGRAPDPMKLAGMVIGMVNAMADKMRENAEATAAANGKTVGCRKGCSFCCYTDVQLTAAEVAAIAIHLREEDRPEVQRRATANLAKRDAVRRRREGRYRIPCIFLEPGGVCGIYDIRPLACRSHFSLSRTACEREWRNPKRAGEKRRVPMPTAPKAVAAATMLGMELALESVGVPVAALDLDAGLAAILEPGALERWLAGDETVFGAIRVDRFNAAIEEGKEAGKL